MHPLILLVNQLKIVDDSTKINAYLDLQKQLLEFTGLKADDPRLSMYVRKEGDISISINSRRVLSLVHQQKNWRIQLMVNEADLAESRQMKGYLSNLDESFSTRASVPAWLIRFDLAIKPYENSRLMQLWQNAVLDYLHTATATPFPKKHNNCLFAATMNIEARQQLLDWIKQGTLTEKELENEAIVKLFNLDKSTDTPSVSDSNLTQKDNKMPTFPLNQILYGPPGTGKTYHTINKALEILGVDATDKTRKELKDIFDTYVEAGQIVFTTFHQSMSYEDFIEGIKPIEPENEGDIMIYKVVDGVFRRISTDACFAIAQQKMPTKTKEVIDFSTQYDNYIGLVDELLLQGKSVKVSTRSKAEIFIDGISPNRNITVKHSEGKRTYIVSKDRLTKLNQAFNELDNVTNIDAQFREVIGGSNASAYWAILNAIRKAPLSKKTETHKVYTYEEKKAVVSSMLKSDFKYESKDKQAKPYVLIIDEINRGNVSQIFGELITLIEDDKRLGKDEALEITLPYSKTSFGVPSNLYIIGTMNTADRSVEALDTALRRRFSFVEMPPQYNLPELATDIDDVKLSDILQTINDRIEVLLNKDNLIGHSYFLSVKDAGDLKVVFQNKIMPLLQEYFFGDYGKIGMVLGGGFVEKKTADKSVFSDFEYDSGFEDRVMFSLKDVVKMSDEDFKTAISTLINAKK